MRAVSGPASDPIAWDDQLLRGFRFACQPNCGLCCFAEPRLSPTEVTKLTADPTPISLVQDPDGYAHLPGFPNGGSCRYLVNCRCSIRARRPPVCVRFPVHIHGGPGGWQFSVVLSCPGLSLDGFERWAGSRPPLDVPIGLDEETASARATVNSVEARILWEEARRRRSSAQRRMIREGRWIEPAELRSTLRDRTFRPNVTDLPGEELPEMGSAEELLPIFYDGRPGPVALSGHPGGWQLSELSPSGGPAGWTDVVPVPKQLPKLDGPAERLLSGYLGYWVARAAFFDHVLWQAVQLEDGETILDLAAAELKWIAATVLARAQVRARSRGRFSDALGAADIQLGISATDADLLDRPDLGARL